MGLIRLYRRPRQARDDFGCVLRRGRRPVGLRRPDRDVWTLRRALLVASIDTNPTPWRGEPDDPNWGYRVWTSDALLVLGHQIQPAGWVVTRFGAVITTTAGGISVVDDPAGHRPPSEIPPPVELPLPFMAAGPDPDYARALFEVLAADDDRARRVAAAIDWLDLAWRNTTSTSVGTRIVLLKAGFEALLAAGHTLPPQRAALAALLGRLAGRRRWRVPINRHGNPLPRERMSDVEWWYSRFTWLRNTIAHGGRQSGRGDWRHGRVEHFWLGDHWLRAAIRCEVADATGRPYLREDDPDLRRLHSYLHQRCLV